ncbi:MAG TPA: SRPBCC domain-containing protein, partial [Micrococcaceae bacterium]
MDQTQLSVHINADAEQVWRMLREPALIAQWHGWEMDTLSDEIQEIYYTDVTEGPDHLSLNLAMGDVFRLEPVADGTRLTMSRGQATGEWEKYDA